jgi:hypothetical protein
VKRGSGRVSAKA